MRSVRRRIVAAVIPALTLLPLMSASAAEKKPVAPVTATAPAAAAKPSTEVKTAADPNKVVARVNGTEIRQGSVDQMVKMMGSQNPALKNPSEELQKKMEGYVLEQLINQEVLYQASKKQEVKNLDAMVDQVVSQYKGRFSSEDEFHKSLLTSGLSEKEFADLARRDVLINSLIDKDVLKGITVTDAEIKKFYDENPDKFKKSETIKASHILCGVNSGASPEEKKKAREKAEELHKQILAGKDFAELAKSNSTCPSSKQGGDLGEFGKGVMVPAFENAAFALKTGEVSDVVETQFGYHIIKLTDRKPGGAVDLATAKGDIEQYLKGQKAQKAVAEYVGKLRKDAKIEMIGR